MSNDKSAEEMSAPVLLSSDKIVDANFQSPVSSKAASSVEEKDDQDLMAEKHALTEEELQAQKDQLILELEQKRKREAQEIEGSSLPGLLQLFTGRKRSRKDVSEEIATQPSVYDDPSMAPYFQPTAKYENLHRFDPSFRWKWGDEKKLVRRLDWRITAWACIAL